VKAQSLKTKRWQRGGSEISLYGALRLAWHLVALAYNRNAVTCLSGGIKTA
jgi:hypothetical protein